MEKPVLEVNAMVTDDVATRLKSSNRMFHMVTGVGDGESEEIVEPR